MNDLEFRYYIADSGYWGNSYILPEDPTATYVLISQLQKREIATPAEILERYESQLLKRRSEAPQNQRTLDVLAFLYSATGQSEKLKEIDLYGWKIVKMQNYAESYIQSFPQSAPEYEEVLEEAATDFPNSFRIQRANLTFHNQSQDRPLFLMKYVAAQFSDVRNHLLGPFRLNDFIVSLEYEVGKSNNSLKKTGSEKPPL